MTDWLARLLRVHYAWVIAGTTFLILLVSAGVRATPSVLMVPLEAEFGWTRAAISGAVAINIALFGLIGPFAAALMDRWGLRRVVAFALVLLATSVAVSTQMKAQWQLVLLWGVLVGTGTGVTSLVLAAIVANRWFEQRRGLVVGALSAANATGQLLFLPFLARLIARSGWRSATLAVAAVAAVVCIIAAMLMRDRPETIGLKPYGWRASDSMTGIRPRPPLHVAGSFFVCGESTNGLIGTHLIPACHDYGIPEVRAAGLLAVMGIFDIIGTTASGWLTDRFPSRYLLFAYYALRGLSLLFLPATLAQGGSALAWFAIFYGLDWVATVPPTVRLTADYFGRENTGVVYGWIGAAHQLGASLAAIGAGTIRTQWGDYRSAFWISGAICFTTAFVFLTLRRRTLIPAAETLNPVPLTPAALCERE
jgi:sugar phosphate permease